MTHPNFTHLSRIQGVFKKIPNFWYKVVPYTSDTPFPPFLPLLECFLERTSWLLFEKIDYFIYQLQCTIPLFIYNMYVTLQSSRHVSSINMPIFRRTNCIITEHLVSSLSVQYSTVCRIRADCRAVCSHPAYCTAVYRVTKPDAVIIQFVLLKMGMLMLETCREDCTVTIVNE